MNASQKKEEKRSQQIIVIGGGCGEYPMQYLEEIYKIYSAIIRKYAVTGNTTTVELWLLGGKTNQKSHPGKTEADALYQQLAHYVDNTVDKSSVEYVGLKAKKGATQALTALQSLEWIMATREPDTQYRGTIIVCEKVKIRGISVLWRRVATEYPNEEISIFGAEGANSRQKNGLIQKGQAIFNTFAQELVTTQKGARNLYEWHSARKARRS